MSKKLSLEEFIEKAKEIHGDKYDYSKVEYINTKTKVCIICPEHGEFWQTPGSHLNGSGCPECGNNNNKLKQTYTTEEFINKAKKIHGDKYDYSKVEYKGCKEKVCIICPEHGEFWQIPDNHLRGEKCKKCYDNKRSITLKSNIEEFIQKAKKIHGDKYDYSKVEYINTKTKVCIICPEHGEFWQTPGSHLNGSGCPECKRILLKNKIMPFNDFVKKATFVHKNEYKYVEETYNGLTKKIKIICPKHGEFWQEARIHLKGCKCNKCVKLYSPTTEEFIEKAREIHGDKYDYSKVEYENANKKICIICPEHGEFWQTPYHHISRKQGCPICNESHLEKETARVLKENNIRFEYQKRFDWLDKQSLDFYLPDYNIAIECQGIQHFQPTDFANNGIDWAKEQFTILKTRDKKKKILCKENILKLEYIKYNENVNYKIKEIIKKYDNKNNCL